jgi:hypothetical protein
VKCQYQQHNNSELASLEGSGFIDSASLTTLRVILTHRSVSHKILKFVYGVTTFKLPKGSFVVDIKLKFKKGFALPA